MKKLFLLFTVILFVYCTVNAQAHPSIVTDEKMYKKNKKMTYDGNSKFLFFYEDLLDIPFDMKGKKKEKRRRKNAEITASNSNRLNCLQNNFPYSYDIIYPNSFNYNLDSNEYRYVVVMVSNSGGSPIMSPNDMMTGGSSPWYKVKVLDIWTKQRMKVTRQYGSFDFCFTVKAVYARFKKNAGKI